MNHSNDVEFGRTLSQPEADEIRTAIALCSGAWTGDYNVKEIKRPIFVYNVYLQESDHFPS